MNSNGELNIPLKIFYCHGGSNFKIKKSVAHSNGCQCKLNFLYVVIAGGLYLAEQKDVTLHPHYLISITLY